MSCERWQRLLAQAADDRPEAIDPRERARLAEHLDRCAGCRERLAEQRAVRRLLAARPVAAVPAGFAARVRARIDAAPHWTDLLAWRTWTLRLAPVAAGLLLVTALAARDALQADRPAGVPELAATWAAGEAAGEGLPAFALLGAEGVGADVLLDAVLSSEPDEPWADWENPS